MSICPIIDGVVLPTRQNGKTLPCANLVVENAKLRELVRKVDHYERLGCYDCPHSGRCDVGTLYDEDCAMSREIEREKRELGIEADA